MNRLKLIADLLKESTKDDDVIIKTEHSSIILTCMKIKKIRLVLIIMILI